MKISNVTLLIAYGIMTAEFFIGRPTDVPYIFFGVALICICLEREFLNLNKIKGGAE